MPKASISSSTKGAMVKKRGHTAGSRYGQDPNYKGRNSTDSRDLSIKD